VGTLNNELLAEIVSLSAQSVLIVDSLSPELEIVFANPAFEWLSGYSAAELVGSSWLSYAAADEGAPELVRLRQSVGCNDAGSLSLPFLRKDGSIWLARLRLTPLESSIDGKRLMLVEHMAADRATDDSAELLKRSLGLARKKIASLDRIDPVTGLISKSQFDLMLRRDMAIARRENHAVHLLLFSIPELDIYRMTFGDNAADSCLRMIGAQISGTFRRAGDLSARVDKSILAVSLTGLDFDQVAQLCELVERKTRNLGLHNPRGRIGRHVVVQGVIVVADPVNEDVDGLMARATAALEKRNESPSVPAAAPS
jgi:diguanylate cyclase (GGDEF)-like protein/PAS domain S-box-containing protein